MSAQPQTSVVYPPWIVVDADSQATAFPGEWDVTTKDGDLIFTDRFAPFACRALIAAGRWVACTREQPESTPDSRAVV